MRSCSKYVAAGLAFLAFAANASVHTNTYVGGDVSLPGSYNDNYVPGEGDFVKIGANTTLAATYGTEEWTLVSSLGRIVPLGTNSVLELTVPGEESSVEFDVPVSAYYFVYVDTWKCGTIVKKGAGRLTLTSTGRVNFGKDSDYDYFTQLHASEGTLAMPTTSRSKGENYQIGRVIVDSGAKFVLPKGNGLSWGAFCHHGVFGYGMVTNEFSVESTLQVTGSDSNGEFRGPIGGNIMITASGSGRQNFYGKEGTIPSYYSYDVRANDGIIGIEYFNPGDGSGSSVGNSYDLRFGTSGGFEYLGNGPSTNVTPFYISKGMSLYGGPYGGVWHTGSWSMQDASKNVNYVVNLCGTNPIPCVIAGSMPANFTGTNGFAHCISVVKSGSGAWRMAENGDRMHAGVTEVRGGVLQFDSVEEAGRISSLGLSTNLVAAVYGGRETETPVDYAILLAKGEGESEATLEFTGTKSQACTTRLISIDGEGGLRNENSATTIRWSGINAHSDGSTLVLDGASTKSNEVAEVRDGVDGERLRVVKRGTGTWVLGGSNTFSGPVSVEAGKLLVRTVLPGDYTWFKWVWRKRAQSSGTAIQMEEMELYDADGNPQNLKLSLATGGYSDLEPGQCALGSNYSTIPATASATKPLSTIFSGSHNSYLYVIPVKPMSSSGFTIYGVPTYYMPIVMRLAAGKSAIDSWDYMNVWRSDNPSSIVASSLYGSVDGLHWNEVDSNENGDVYYAGEGTSSETSWYWAFAGTRYVAKKNTGGRKLKQSASTVTYNPLAGNPCVSVAPGATLEAEGGSPVISSLSVAYSGTGTIKGFTFAETGSIDFVGDLPKGAVSVPVALEECSGVENLGAWSVTFNGESLSSRAVVWTGSSFKIYPPGAMIIIK